MCLIFKDVKCSGNWMWAAKLPGEGACLWDACKAMCDVMGQLGVAIDGGKDSLSMAARVGKETVKAPGTSCGLWFRSEVAQCSHRAILLSHDAALKVATASL